MKPHLGKNYHTLILCKGDQQMQALIMLVNMDMTL